MAVPQGVACRVCGESRTTRFLEVTSKHASVKEGLFDHYWSFCQGCSAITNSPGPWDGYAARREWSADTLEEYAVMKEELQRARRVGLFEREFFRVAPRDFRGKAFEVGSNTGAFLHVLRRMGFEVAGIDGDSALNGLARRRYGIDVSDGFYGGDSLPEASIDLWLMAWVLDLTDSPREIIAAASKHVREGGYVYFLGTNLSHPVAQYYGGHRHHMVPGTVAWLFESYGFRVLTCKSVSQGYHTGTLVIAQRQESARGSRSVLPPKAISLHMVKQQARDTLLHRADFHRWNTDTAKDLLRSMLAKYLPQLLRLKYRVGPAMSQRDLPALSSNTVVFWRLTENSAP